MSPLPAEGKKGERHSPASSGWSISHEMGHGNRLKRKITKLARFDPKQRKWTNTQRASVGLLSSVRAGIKAPEAEFLCSGSDVY